MAKEAPALHPAAGLSQAPLALALGLGLALALVPWQEVPGRAGTLPGRQNFWQDYFLARISWPEMPRTDPQALPVFCGIGSAGTSERERKYDARLPP